MLAIALVSILPAAAAGQIYAWRDADGTLVLSDRPRNPDARRFPVTGGPQIRSTRPAAPQAAARYEAVIRDHADRHGVRPELVRAVIQTESAFDPRAVSPKGAMGLMQLMPTTARLFGVLDPFNPFENIRAGVAYLRQLLDRYNGNEELALAAYNAGPEAVDRHGGVPPYRETRDYVARVTGRAPASVRGTTRIYRTVDVIDGRPVPRYTNLRATAAPREIVTGQER
ncbi:MAG TPA: lytic transglycosylase domain-containing protein [Vicinamibacterales bacterium]|nr:lytic transglycosylase domain-containing protein [Vicinamibacterales bacterium]